MKQILKDLLEKLLSTFLVWLVVVVCALGLMYLNGGHF